MMTEAVVPLEGLGLSAMQGELLKRVRASFPLLADISHSSVALYVPRGEGGGFALVAQERPHTVYAPADPLAAGRLSADERERLLSGAMQTRKEAQEEAGCAFPVMEGDVCVAAALLCPREGDFGAAGRGWLRQMAGMILRQGHKRLDPEQYRHISASDGILAADQSGRILFANTAARRIYHVLGIGSLVGRRLSDPRLMQYVKRETVEKDRPWERELLVGNLLLVMRDIPFWEGGILRSRIVVLSDVTELRKKEQELRMQELAVQEVHHRVKNSLQMVASLLRMQARRSLSEEARAALEESIGRVMAVAAVHEMLSVKKTDRVHVKEIAEKLLDVAARGMAAPGFALSVSCEGADVILPASHANPIALILNELAANAMEHAFIGRAAGRISFLASERGQDCVLELWDDGIGLPEGFAPGSGRSLGLRIVQGLVEDDLGGSLAMENRNGAYVKIVLPREMEN